MPRGTKAAAAADDDDDAADDEEAVAAASVPTDKELDASRRPFAVCLDCRPRRVGGAGWTGSSGRSGWRAEHAELVATRPRHQLSA